MAEHLTSDYQQKSLPIDDASHSADASRIAKRLAKTIGFSETQTGQVAIVVTELASNILKHARRGEILIRPLARGRTSGIEVIALDRGPGISHIAQAFRDGYSTAGSPGTGLGAVARLAEEFDIYSIPGNGTAVLARVWSKGADANSTDGTEHGVVFLPKAGEEVSGDGWSYAGLADKSVYLVTDGLGHGPNAAAASRAAIDICANYRAAPPVEIVERAHGALRSTRGAAVAVAQIDYSYNSVRYCGLGNISAAIITGGTVRRMVSLNGTAGQQAHKINEYSYPWTAESILVMHSDGLTSHWDLQHTNLAQRHPSLIAALLYRDNNRNRDDVTVLVAKSTVSVVQRNTPWLTL